ncbi:50S ribosomal protein L5 [Patescibacteria group bacterium]|nr:50S ribosomal protein L5 [Patescibacteria group bacterium]
MHRILEKYQKQVAPAMKKRFGYKNNLAIPKLSKVVINVGTGAALKDAKMSDVILNTIQRITGQKPVSTKAKKSISAFKIREGLAIGMMTTLRGKMMYDFIDKLINITLPRIRDFRGLEAKSVDNNGNLNIGFKEHIAFPEIHSDEVEKIHGLEVAIVSTAKTQEEGIELFKNLGFPIK